MAEENPEVLVMTIEVRPGIQDMVSVRRYDNPHTLAQEFVARHSLDPNLIDQLGNLIGRGKAEAMAKVKSDQWKRWQKMATSTKNNPLTQFERTYVGDISRFNPNLSRIFNQSMMTGPMLSSGLRGNKSMGRGDRSSLSNRSTLGGLPLGGVINKAYMQGIQFIPENPIEQANGGIKLYYEALEKKQQQDKALEQKRQEKEKLELKEATFKPQINSKVQRQKRLKIEDDLIKRAKMAKDRKENRRQKHMESQLKECTFTPKLISRTFSHGSPVGETGRRYQDLYNDAFYRQMRLEEVAESDFKQKYQFKPEIGSQQAQRSTSYKTLPDRLMKAKLEKEEKLERMRKEMSEKELTTFKPVTGRSPKSSRNDEHLPIWEYLYQKRTAKYHSDDECPFSFSAQSNENSEKLYAQYRLKMYQKLFDHLDEDEDGIISKNEINIDSIHPQTLEVMLPVFDQLEERNLNLTFNQFVEKMESLVDKLGPAEKQMLFKPQVRCQTAKIVKQKKVSAKKAQQVSQRMYQAQQEREKRKQEKIKEQQTKKMKSEMKDCTFKPKTGKFNRNIF